MPWPYSVVIAGLWLVWLAYWLVSAARAKTTVKTESGFSQLAYSLPIWLAAWLMWGRGLPATILNQHVLPQMPGIWDAGVALVAIGLGFAAWARVYLGSNWSAAVSVKRDHELVTRGPYAIVRHPIYAGILFAVVGTGLVVGEWRAVIALALALIAFIHKARIEEQWMAETFGPAYAEYRSKVAGLIPFVV